MRFKHTTRGNTSSGTLLNSKFIDNGQRDMEHDGQRCTEWKGVYPASHTIVLHHTRILLQQACWPATHGNQYSYWTSLRAARGIVAERSGGS